MIVRDAQRLQTLDSDWNLLKSNDLSENEGQ